MTVTEPTLAESWAQANHRYLRSELERLRLLLNRRVLWLRQQWQQDPLQRYQGLVISDAQADRLLAAEDRMAERRFYQENLPTAEIQRSLGRIGRSLAEQREALAAVGHLTALDVLVRLLDLSPFERDLLLLCLAPEIDPAFERLYAYTQDDATRKYATLHLALTLFCENDSAWLAGRERLAPDAPLRQLDLLVVEAGASLSSPLRVSPRTVDYLLGLNRIEKRLSHLLRPMPLLPLTPQLRSLAERLESWVASRRNKGFWPAVNLVGPPGGGKRALARALGERLGLKIFHLDAALLPATDPEQEEILRLLEREVILSQIALYLDLGGLESRPERPETTIARHDLTQLTERVNTLLIVGSREPWPAERPVLTVQVAKPNAAAQNGLWRQTLAGYGAFNGKIGGLVQQFDLGPSEIHRAVESARENAFLQASPNDPPSMVDLWQACRAQSNGRLEDLALRIVPCHTWEDIVLPDHVREQLREIAAQVANRSRVYEDWGFGAKLNRGRGISALFSGVSGTGKTLAAEILASDLDLDLFRIDLSSVVSKYIGETEKNLRRVFDAAEQSGAILLFDEADALFGKRSEVKDSHDRYANIEVNYLLQRMEDYRGLAILATNMKSHMDQAFLRRLRFLVDFPFPDAEQRTRIWQRIFPERAALEGIDYMALSRLEIPGGNIKNVSVNAAFLASREGDVIRMNHLMRAARREYEKIDRIITQAEFGPHATEAAHAEK